MSLVDFIAIMSNEVTALQAAVLADMEKPFNPIIFLQTDPEFGFQE